MSTALAENALVHKTPYCFGVDAQAIEWCKFTLFAMSIPYQKTYDRAVIQELVVWFRERFDRLPQRIQLRPGMVIPDVKVMVRNYLDVVQMHYENPTYGAQVHHLFEVRDCLLAEGFE